MKRRRSSAPGRLRPDGRWSHPILLVAVLAVLLAGCDGGHLDGHPERLRAVVVRGGPGRIRVAGRPDRGADGHAHRWRRSRPPSRRRPRPLARRATHRPAPAAPPPAAAATRTATSLRRWPPPSTGRSTARWSPTAGSSRTASTAWPTAAGWRSAMTARATPGSSSARAASARPADGCVPAGSDVGDTGIR